MKTQYNKRSGFTLLEIAVVHDHSDNDALAIPS